MSLKLNASMLGKGDVALSAGGGANGRGYEQLGAGV